MQEFTDLKYHISGYWSYGMHLTLCLALSLSYPSSALSTKSLSRCSYPVSSSMTRPIALGGLEDGTVVDSELMLCLNLRANSLSRSLRCRCGAPISCWATFCFSCSHLLSWFPTSIVCTPRCYVSACLLLGSRRGLKQYLPVWLRPSKQIRAPLYSLKQRRQRRFIVS